MDLGDRTLGDTIRFAFFTTAADGTPTTLSGTPGLSVYKDASTTQTVAGVSLLTDFDSMTGYNSVSIDTSADAFYEAGSDYMVVITTGTVDGVSVVGAVVATFSIENRYPSAAAVNAEVVDALATDTQSLPGQAAPPNTPTIVECLTWLYKAFRNKKTNDGSVTSLFDDAGSVVDSKQTTSESSGTVTKGEWETGP